MAQDEIRTASSILVGVGGWAYLPIKRGNKLEVCSNLYDYVEVNSMFYELPTIERVRKWRKTVPDSFEFTLRANRELTHVGHLEPSEKNFKIYEKIQDIAKELDARILHFQFPPSFEPSNPAVKNWRDFFSSIQTKVGRLKFALEVRHPLAHDSKELSKMISEYDIIPTVDASRENLLGPSSRSRLFYTRVFGRGEHTKWIFDSDELGDLAKKVDGVKATKKYVTFHNFTMYEDASRMSTVLETGKERVQPENAPLGLDSLKRVIASSRAKYPATKQSLLDDFGWKTFDLSPEKKVHVEKELLKLEDGSYDSVQDVLQALRKKS